MAIKNLTKKIQGQGHGWGQSLKLQRVSNLLSNQSLKSHNPISYSYDKAFFFKFDSPVPEIQLFVAGSFHLQLRLHTATCNAECFEWIKMPVWEVIHIYLSIVRLKG